MVEKAFEKCIHLVDANFEPTTTKKASKRRLNPNKTKKHKPTWFNDDCLQLQIQLLQARRHYGPASKEYKEVR